MKYRISIDFEEGISKEKVEYLLASLKYRKMLWHSADNYPVVGASLTVADEEPLPEPPLEDSPGI